MKALNRLELEAIIDAIPTAVVVIEKVTGKVIYSNDRSAKLFGANLHGLEVPSQTNKLVKTITLGGDEYPYEKRQVCQVLLTGQEVEDEFIIERPDGSRALVSASARPAMDDKGTIIAAVGVYEDVTERKITEEALEEERQTLKAIIESTETMIAYLDLNFNFVIVNSAYAKGSGYSIEELIGKNHFMLFPNEENQVIFKRVRDTGQPVVYLDKPFEFLNQPERGVTYWDWTLTPAKDREARVYGLVFTLMETTERKKAEEALRKSEERFRLVAEAANVLVYEIETGDKNSTIIRGEKILGYKHGEIPLTPKWWFDQLHPDDRNATEDKLDKAIDAGIDILLEYRIKRKQGDYIWVHDTAKMVKDEYGKVIRIIGGVRDITERKKVEDTIRRSEEQLRAFMMATSDMVFRMSPDWTEMRQLQGRNFSEQPNKTWLEKYIPKPDQQTVMAAIKQAINTKGAVELEHRICFEGNMGWAFSRAIPLLANDGSIIEWLGTLADITERKKALEAVKENEERLELAQRVARLGSWEFYVKDDRAVWSKELFHIFGRKPDEGAPNIAEYTKLIYPDDAKEVANRMQKFLGSGKLGETIYFDYSIVKPDGSVRVLQSGRMITEVNEKGKAIRIIGVEQDITERKRMQSQLEEYSKSLERLVEERTKQLRDKERLATIGATAGMVGHDIRNPLQAMLSDVYLLKDFLKSMPEMPMKRDVTESLDGLENNISYVNKIVADLQDYARPLKPEYTEINLQSLINDILATVAVPENINLNVIVEELRFVTEPTFIKRALTNLVNNAIQAMPEGGQLGLTTKRTDNKVIITVSDTGKGIPEDVKPQLFKPLMTTKAKGQGLGLAVVKRLVEGLNGEVGFESEEGKGTKFYIELPANV